MIIPSLDFIQGKIVRLYKGNYLKKTQYQESYFLYIENCIKNNIKNLHIVDLDGARDPKRKQLHLLQDILKNKNINFQVGGGIRTEKDIEKLFFLGAKRVVLSSIIFKKKNVVKNWIERYGQERIVLALDIKIKNSFKEVVVAGWRNYTGICIEDIIDDFLENNIKYILCTDVSQDGTLNGPNLLLYSELIKKYPSIYFQASGGVSSINDIINLKKTGVKNIIIGKAFLEKKFTFFEAIQCLKK
ncbi:1-(5-phosphoribosyl)-5-[(5-phosphoribosylamino)methylideneamino]imidazole-4-carboxamide isomerase [Buchnera aphidicola]|uniref:1-(5-phosphoribosyl)-5-[(5- phosphoribosylamino)methylideneamino]imidazole-4- carboxamide isomerase n=1 Tax=Buchnera aphidicola TaxID=9 RepID=UPI0034647E63